ncbi:MAG: hypothetical protein AAF802_01260 [Planctomycetota bacterium]
MTTHSPRSPKLARGGIVVLDPDSGVTQQTIALQYNPQSLTRSVQPQTTGGEGGDRSQTFRLTGPAVETIQLDAEIDAADYLEDPQRFAMVRQNGIQPQLAVLQNLAYPTSESLERNNSLQAAGTLEILPSENPLTLFVWGNQRIIPVRLTDIGITEEAFDESLNPIRAKVSLGMRVLSVSDVGFDHRAGTFYMAHQRRNERLARQSRSLGPSNLGAGGF